MHPAQSARVIRRGHHHNRMEPLLVAPVRENWTFILISGDIPRYAIYVIEAERFEFSNGSRGWPFIGNSAMHKFVFCACITRIHKYCYARPNPTMDEIGGFEGPSSVRIDSNDDVIRVLVGIVDDQGPSHYPQRCVSPCRYCQAGTERQQHQ